MMKTLKTSMTLSKDVETEKMKMTKLVPTELPISKKSPSSNAAKFTMKVNTL